MFGHTLFKTSRGLRGVFVPVTRKNWREYFAPIVDIENESFVASIREDRADLAKSVLSDTAICLVVELQSGSRPIAYALADRLERYPDVPGIVSDVHFGEQDTLYVASIAVRAEWRRNGIGVACVREIGLRAQAAGFQRVSAHVRVAAGRKINPTARVLGEFQDWYSTGERFEYVEWTTSALADLRNEAAYV